ncbi:MAG: glycoside hydrolase family 30 beta sandwich domain-containing protein [Parcubacteria group bacterium]
MDQETKFIFLAIIFLALFGLAQSSQAATININTAQTYQTILGFGGNASTRLLNETNGQQTLQELSGDLNLVFVRAPVDLSISQSGSVDGYLAAIRASSVQTPAWNYAKALNALGAEPMFVLWSLPSWMEDSNGTLKSTSIGDAVNYWTAIVQYARNEQNISFRFIELVNEPDGSWGTYISPTTYWQLIQAMSAEWDSRNLPVKIVGPGTAFMSSLPGYLNSMPASIPSHLGMISTHTWDTLSDPSEFVPYIASAQNVLDPKGLKLMVTEYGTKFLGDADYCQDPSPTDKPAYASYVAGMTHYFLSTNIINSLLIWDLYDMFGCAGGSGTKIWGLRKSAAKGFAPRPHNFALQIYYRLIPEGAVRVGTTVTDDPSGNVLATSYKSSNSVVSVIINKAATNSIITLTGLSSQQAAYTMWEETDAYGLTGGSFSGGSFTLPPKSVTGFVFSGGDTTPPAAPSGLSVQ